MKQTIRSLVLPILLLITTPTMADDYAQSETGEQGGRDMEKLVTYMENLSSYLGFDVKTPFPLPVIPFISTLLDYSQTPFQKLFQQASFVTLFGAIPVNNFSKELSYFTQAGSNYEVLNAQANYTFLNPSNYSSPSTDTLSVIQRVDQKDYQSDPVSQAVLNLIGTPSTCARLGSSQCVSKNTVMTTVLSDVSEEGFLPSNNVFFTYDSTKKFLSQLNGNTLIAPLLYTAEGASSGDRKEAAGLPSASQEQQAANFIRYATGGVSPLSLISSQDYDTLWSKAYPNTSSIDARENQTPASLAAQESLATYLTGIRVYAAQSSVPIANLYSILSKRMPQQSKAKDSTGAPSQPTSQALSELQMASWRLYNPQSKSNQWVDQINTASSASVQKEIAILLSEINYQMYLNRQQEERILLTNSLQLLVSMAQNKPPTPDLSSTTE